MRPLWTPESLGSIVVLVAITLCSCSNSPQQKEARYLASGKNHLARKDYARAELDFKNAIRVMPRDAEPYFQLGIANLGKGNLVSAVGMLRKATEFDPNHTAAQVKLADLMALSGITSVVEQGEKRMQQALRQSPDNVDVLDGLALAESRLGKWQDAQEHLRRALDRLPQSVTSAVALAKLYLDRRDFASAEKILQKTAIETPQSAAAPTALGQVYMLAGNWRGAEAQFRTALKIDPHFALATVGLASAEIKQSRPEEAEQTLQTLSRGPDREYRPLYAAYLSQEGKRDLAIKELKRLFDEDPADRDARSRLVAAYLSVNKGQDADAVLTSALKKNPNDIDALLQRSQILLRLGKQKEAERDILQILHYEPGSAKAHYFLAHIYRSGGQSLREQQELAEAVRFDPNFLMARLELADRLTLSNSAKAALELLDAAPQNQQRIVALVIQRNWDLLILGQDKEARNSVDRALKVIRDPDLLTQDSVLKLHARDYAGARASAMDALKGNPENARALRVVVDTYMAEKQPAAAMRTLHQLAQEHPTSTAPQQYLGEWLLASGDLAQARLALTAARNTDPQSVSVALDLVQLDVAQGRLDEARATLVRTVTSDPGNPNVHLWLGNVEMKAGDYGAAVGEFRKVLDLDSTNVAALNNAAYLLATEENKPDEALPLAERAFELAPHNIDAEGTLGWVFYRKGLYEMAVRYLSQAVASDEGSSAPNAVIRKYHLGEAYIKHGERASGLKTLTAALQANPNMAEAQIAKAEISGR